MLPITDISACQGMAVSPEIMHHVVNVESSFNPYAIGVVGGRLVHQPKNLPEALATVGMLEEKGYNFSIGLAQVNRYNLAKYGLSSYQQAFEVCPNLQAGSRILAECFSRSGGDWGKSLSCYYSGNFITGYRHGYVQKVFASMRENTVLSGVKIKPPAIPVIGKAARHVMPVQRHPFYSASRVERSLPRSLSPLLSNLQPIPQISVPDTDLVARSPQSSVDEAFVF